MNTKQSCSIKDRHSWTMLYLFLARELRDEFGFKGKAAIREGIRRYASTLGTERQQELESKGYKLNLETLFADGYGLPCGEGSQKEWIEVSPQKMFVNIISCPYAACWLETGEQELGSMYCEEFYSAFTGAFTFGKGQSNVSKRLTKEGVDDICRLSIYLRPANLTKEQRCRCFEEFDLNYTKAEKQPESDMDFQAFKRKLLNSFLETASELFGDEGTDAVNAGLSKWRAFGFSEL